MRPEPALHGVAEQRLLDTARRMVRHGRAARALVVHLSILLPPSPRPHHARIARAMLHEAAQRHDGELLAMSNGDLVLLSADASDRHAGSAGLAGLPALLTRLLQVDAPDPDSLISVWRLPGMADQLLGYAASRGFDPPRLPGAAAPAAEAPASGRTGLVDALAALADDAPIGDLLRRQTAIHLPRPAADGAPIARTLQPLFRELSFSIAGLEARIAGGAPARADPYLFRHLAGRLDRRILEVVAEAAGSGAALDPCRHAAPPVHLNLTVPAIASPAFERLAIACGGAAPHARLGIEVSLMEACADPAAFAAAAARVRGCGCALVLDDVSHQALTLVRIAPLRADLVKLRFASRMVGLSPDDAGRLDAALAGLGPDRVLLARAQSEAALRWGLARGIRRFQGGHVEAMLAAARLAACGHAAACTLRQCTERAQAAGMAARRFCRDHALLDAASPGAVWPAGPARVAA